MFLPFIDTQHGGADLHLSHTTKTVHGRPTHLPFGATSSNIWGCIRLAVMHWSRTAIPESTLGVLHFRPYFTALPTKTPECSHRVWARNGRKRCSDTPHTVLAQIVYHRVQELSFILNCQFYSWREHSKEEIQQPIEMCQFGVRATCVLHFTR